MKYTIITGEKSGDLHGARLVQQIKHLDKEAIVQYTGGLHLDNMGDEKILDIDKMAFMGFYEILSNLGNIFSNFKLIKRDIKSFQPDVIIFVDYAGMNLRLAKWAKSLGFKTVYYILPKAWAWKSSRAKIVADNIDLALSIFPFELPFYKDKGVEARFVGNPSYQSYKTFVPDHSFKTKHNINKPILALIPGSRAQEIKRNLKVMIKAGSYFKDYQIVISKVSNLPRDIYPDSKDLIITEDFYNLITHAEYAYVTSGTANLDLAIANVPQIVIYKSSWLSMSIAKALIKVNYISLVNLICNREIVKELIQADANEERMIKEMAELMHQQMTDKSLIYKALHSKLAQSESDYSAAELITQLGFNK